MSVDRREAKLRPAWLLFGAALFLLTSENRAEDVPKLVMKMTVAKEVKVKEGGKTVTKLEPVKETKKADVLVYTITYSNEGTGPAVEASVIGPVPEGTTYVPDSASTVNTELSYSINKAKTFHRPPVRYEVKKDDGTTIEKTATEDMYTHVKWLLAKPVAPGRKGGVTFKVIVK